MSGGALPTKQPSAGLHSTIFTCGSEADSTDRARREASARESLLAPAGLRICRGTRGCFDGILDLPLLIRLGIVTILS